MEIKTSLDWQKVYLELNKQTSGASFAYKPDMVKLASAISSMVQELSMEEINCRRQHKQTKKHKELLDKINEQIHNYETMVTFGLLLTK
jgi:hypothetical protein